MGALIVSKSMSAQTISKKLGLKLEKEQYMPMDDTARPMQKRNMSMEAQKGHQGPNE